MANQYAAARDIDQTSTVLDGAGLVGGADYREAGECRVCSIRRNIP